MAIPDPVRTNFDTLLRAADDGNLALMECLDYCRGERLCNVAYTHAYDFRVRIGLLV